jgi:crotonobetainyl-CoA:carnitine CoA-transferase CaiB-like acyl-CoA transferase
MHAADLEDVAADPHFAATGFFRMRDHPVAGPMREMRPPVRYGADPNRTLGFAPVLGADGHAVRAELTAQRSG